MTDTHPLVSIITPSFNHARFIERTILSVKSQDYDNVEHIVVDGGSSDGTLDILSKHAGSYNMRWVSQPDNGMYEAVNKGVRMSGGAILAYLNSDDAYYPWAIRTAVTALTRNPSAGLVYGDIAFFDERTGRGSVLIYPTIDRMMLARAVNIPQPATFWRRAVSEEIGEFKQALRAAGDLDFWLRVLAHTNVMKIDEVVAADSRRPNALRKEFAAEYKLIRREKYMERGPRELALFLGQAVRYYALGQTGLSMFTFRALLHGFGLRRGANGAWREFLQAHAGKLALSRLLLANIPTRRRLQGLGLLIRPPLEDTIA